MITHVVASSACTSRVGDRLEDNIGPIGPEMASNAGFSRVEEVPFDNPFNKHYLPEKQAA